ncbi:MAG: hypothetical protein JHC95_03085 [Solirubrobacteraceae bacterium]|nr:hypothetical protein [Solirubrobacteraceae bacterium]
MPRIDLAPATLRRLLPAVAACALVIPAPAFAQGAGDDQYKDPFPETTAQDAQNTPTSTTGEGLSDTPPTSSTTTEEPATADTGAATSGASDSESASEDSSDSALARTGDDPWLVALAGASLLLLGGGLRLRSGAQRRH